MVSSNYHLLLSSRFVCENCLTRFFTPHAQCPACLVWDRIRPLTESLIDVADNDEELRNIIARGQQVLPAEPTTEEFTDLAAAIAALPPEALAELELLEHGEDAPP